MITDFKIVIKLPKSRLSHHLLKNLWHYLDEPKSSIPLANKNVGCCGEGRSAVSLLNIKITSNMVVGLSYKCPVEIHKHSTPLLPRTLKPMKRCSLIALILVDTQF